MTRPSLAVSTATGLLTAMACFVVGCAKQQDEPAPATQPYPAQQAYPATQPYPAQPYPAQETQPQATPPYPAQPNQPDAQPQYASAPAATPTEAGPMATPGALALPCQNDQGCGLGRCNLQYQKCAYPCQTAADCASNATCNTATGFCLPGP